MAECRAATVVECRAVAEGWTVREAAAHSATGRRSSASGRAKRTTRKGRMRISRTRLQQG